MAVYDENFFVTWDNLKSNYTGYVGAVFPTVDTLETNPISYNSFEWTKYVLILGTAVTEVSFTVSGKTTVSTTHAWTSDF